MTSRIIIMIIIATTIYLIGKWDSTLLSIQIIGNKNGIRGQKATGFLI